MQKKISEAIILCAGFGTRLRPITNHTPKPLVKVNNKPVIDYIVKELEEYGIKKIIINSHHLSDQIEKHVEELQRKHSDIEFIHLFEPEILESAGAVKNAIPYFNQKNIFAINGDCIYSGNIINPFELMNEHYYPDYKMFLQLTEKENSYGYDGEGDYSFKDKSDTLLTKEGHREYIYCGITALNLEIFDEFEQTHFSFREIYKKLPLHGIVSPNLWFQVGDIEGLNLAEKFLTPKL